MKEAWTALGFSFTKARNEIVAADVTRCQDKGFTFDYDHQYTVEAKHYPVVSPPPFRFDDEDSLLFQCNKNSWLEVPLELAYKMKIVDKEEYNPKGTPFYTGSVLNNPYRVLGKTFTPIQLEDTHIVVLPMYNESSRHVDFGYGDQFYFLGPSLSKEPFDNSNTQFLLYSDIVESQVVGGQSTNLLATISVNNRGPAEVYFEPRNRVFYPIRKRQFQSITFEVHRRLGELVEFKSGVTFVTLLFQRRVARR